MEYVSGAIAGVLAGIFTNPLDVVKTGLQLQGELEAKGRATKRYKNTIHAVYVIARNDGIVSLQKGLVPALWFQVFLNGTRLGSYGTMEEWGWTKNKDGSVNFLKTVGISIVTGCMGSFLGSPFYLVKTHMQSQGSAETGVGYQHQHKGTWSALEKIYAREGVKGLWRGAVSSFPRVGVGSAAQLTTFSMAKEVLIERKIMKEENPLSVTFVASMMSGVVIALCMTPFDVVQTRLYNQGVDASGKGILYNGIIDCFIKTLKFEGVTGLFKGIGPCYLRIGPHSLLCLVFWDLIKINVQ